MRVGSQHRRAVLLAVVVVVSMGAVGATAVGGTATDGAQLTADTVEERTAVSQTDTGGEETEGTASPASVRLLLSLPRADADLAGLTQTEAVETLQAHAETTQQPVVEQLRPMNVTVRNQFWLGNSIAVTAPADADVVEKLRVLPGVESVVLDREHEQPDPVESSGDVGTDEFGEKPYTDGLVQANVPDLWASFGTQGEGAAIATIDDGVDPSHPDIDLFTEDPDDPTYPGGFVAFDSNAEPIPGAEPQEGTGHGAHVSGTATGGNASGTAIGVAPGADLHHADVFRDSPLDSVIVAAMEWSAEQGVDVVSASLGLGCSSLSPGPGYSDVHIDGIQDLRAMDIAFVSSAGNGGEACVSDPGSNYNAFSVGASDRSGAITDFSSGGLIDKDEGQPDWEGSWENPPAEWPQSWLAPDVAAHGNNVISAAVSSIGSPVEGYEQYQSVSGTSMSAPHVAGALALLRSVEPDASVAELETALEETATKPAGWSETQARWTGDDVVADGPGVDSRYGHGLVDVQAAAQQLVLADLVGFQVGDVNQAGAVTLTDPLLVSEYVAGLDPEPFNEFLADVDRDGAVTMADAQLLQAHVAGTADAGEIAVTNLTAPDAVAGKSGFTVTAELANVGDLGALQDVEFRMASDAGNLTAAESLLVERQLTNLGPAGDRATETVTFRVDTAPLPGDDYYLGVFSNDDSATTTTTVEEPFFAVTGFEAPATADSGDVVDVTATITNTGNVNDTQAVTYDPPGQEPTPPEEFTTVAVVDSQTTTDTDGGVRIRPEGRDSAGVGPMVASALVDRLDGAFPETYLFETVEAQDLPDVVGEYDVFVVNDFGDSLDPVTGEYTPPPFDLGDEFYSELDDDQGAVYLDTTLLDQGNAIRSFPLHNNITGEDLVGMTRADYETAFDMSGSAPIEFEITTDHPLFDGLGAAGDRFTAYEPADQDRVFFDAYDGDLVANVAVEGEPADGPAIGVNESKNEVLLGMGVNSQYQPVDGLTEDGVSLLANAIEHVAPEETGPSTGVPDRSPPVMPDDVAVVDLAPGESTELSFSADLSGLADDSYPHGVVTDDDETIAELNVSRWFFDVSSIEAPAEVLIGDSITVNATVTNTGNATDTQSVEYDLVQAVPDIAVVGGDSGAVSSPRDRNRTETIVDIVENQTVPQVNVEAVSYEAVPNVVGEYDTFVVHRFGANNSDAAGDDRAAAFLDALEPDQSAVYLETAGSAALSGDPDHNYASAVERLVTVRGDPSNVSTETVGIDGSPLVITDDHPIWTGVGSAGDNVTTNVGTGIGQDYAAAFGGYSGTVLGEDPLFDAPAVAVNESPGAGAREVLLTNAVPYEFVEVPGEMTTAGKRVLSNAVEFAAFGEVAPGPVATSKAETVTLDPGESAEVTFPYTVGEDDPLGDAEHLVTTADTEESASVAVTTDKQVDIVAVEAPTTAPQAGAVTVEASLEHVGSEPVTEAVAYVFNGQVLDNTTVDLVPGETTNVTLTGTIPEVEPGEYLHGVTVTFDESFRTIDVVAGEPSEFLVESFDAPASVGQGGTFTVSATVTNADAALSDTQPVEYEFDLGSVDPPVDGVDVVFVDDDAAAEAVPGVPVDELRRSLRGGPLSTAELAGLSRLGEETTPAAFEAYLRSETSLTGQAVTALRDAVTPAGPETLFDRIDTQLDDEVFDLTAISSENLTDSLDRDIYLLHDISVGSFSGPSEAEFEQFLAEIDGPGQGAVFLDQETAFIDGVESLVEFRGDPTAYGGSDDGEGDVMLHVEKNHPLFAGIGTAGDTVQLAEVSAGFDDPGWGNPDRLWFEGYSGQTLGAVGVAGEPADGAAVGVDPGRNEVLLSASGSGSSFSQDADFFSDEALTLVGNAVERLTQRTVYNATTTRTVSLGPGESTTVEFELTLPVEQTPATYEHGVFTDTNSTTDSIEVENLEPDIVVTEQDTAAETVVAGQTITTEAVVVNQGDIVGERSIPLAFNGTVVDTATVELAAGESTSLTLSAATTGADQPAVTVTVDGTVPAVVQVDPSGTANGSVVAGGNTTEAAAAALNETPGEGEPIANATVTVFPDDPDRTGEGIAVGQTDPDGSFETAVLPVGEHGVAVDATGFTAWTGTVVVEAGETTDLGTIELAYADGGTVTGTVDLDLDLDIDLGVGDLSSVDVALVDDSDELAGDPVPGDGGQSGFLNETALDLQDRLDSDVFTVDTVPIDSGTDADLFEVVEEYDVFILHRMGIGGDEAVMAEFLDTVDTDGGQAVIFLDNDASWSASVEDLVAARGDPGTFDSDSAASAVEVDILADHPVFDGIGGAGDTFVTNTDTDDGEWGWFEGYSGRTLAEVGAAGQSRDGVAVGVDEDNSELVLPAFGRGWGMGDHADFTTDAHRLLANAVEYAAVSGLENEPPVGGAGEQIPVTVEVAETGDATTVTVDGVGQRATYTIEGVDVNVDNGYTVTASADAHETASVESVLVDIGGTTNGVDLKPTRDSGGVGGTVVDGTGDPVQGATVSVFTFQNNDTGEPTPGLTREGATDATGAFELPAGTLPAGQHFLTVAADGFDTAGLSVTVEGDTVTDIGTVELVATADDRRLQRVD